MKLSASAALAAAVLILPATVLAGGGSTDVPPSSATVADYSLIRDTSDTTVERPIFADDAQTQQTEKPAAAQKGPPLPFHDIEGFGGGAITPIAYLVNPPLGGDILGLPSVAASYVNLGSKNLEAFTLTENVAGRIELGFGADRLDLGNLPRAIASATSVDVHASDLWLYNFNVRALVIPENSFDAKWVPAVTVGAHYKYNDGIADINNRLGGALGSIGYRTDDGVDFTATATKAFPNVFGRPLIVSVSGRGTEAAQLGFLGFGHVYKANVEANVVYLPFDWLVVAYEYRAKQDPYKVIPGLINKEGDWHAFDVSWLINSHTDLTGGIGYFGVLANTRADAAFWVQLKYEL